MSIDWSKPLVTKSGKCGDLMPAAPFEKRRRVAIARDGRPVTESSKEVTVWLYPEDGIARCDRAPSDMDLVNARATEA